MYTCSLPTPVQSGKSTLDSFRNRARGARVRRSSHYFFLHTAPYDLILRIIFDLYKKNDCFEADLLLRLLLLSHNYYSSIITR